MQLEKMNQANTHDLTQSQLLLWTGQQIQPNAPLYNMIFAFDLAGKIQVQAFKIAFQKLIEQSDAMRTVFRMLDGVPQQEILSELQHDMGIFDWSQEDNLDTKFQDWATERNQRNFDLSTCLFDSVLIKISDERYIWYSSQHHLISDAWSASVLYRTMSDLYRHALNGTLADAPPLPAFQDYLSHEKQARSNNQEALQYWQEKAAALPPPPTLYGISKSIDSIASTQSKRILCDLGEARSAKLRALTQEADIRAWTQHLSLFNIFATVLFAWLHRVSGQQELAISTPAHNRPTPDFKNTPGVFIELFPLLESIQKDDTFGSLFQRVRTSAFEFLKNAQSGIAHPQLNRNINVVLNYVHAEFGNFNGIPATAEWLHPNHADPGHALRLQVMDFDASGNIQLYFDVNESPFPKAFQAQISTHFLALLDAFIADRSQSVHQLSLVASPNGLQGKADNQLVENTVLDLFEQQVKQSPNNIVISAKGNKLTYQQVHYNALQLANYLIQKGVQQGDRIAIYLKRSPDLLTSILAIWKAGATYIPIATDYPIERVNYMLQDAEAALLITHQDLAKNLSYPTEKIVHLDKDKSTIQQISAQAITTSPASTAYIMYTSGSTGQPKGVGISQQSLGHYVQWAERAYLQTLVSPLAPKGESSLLFTRRGDSPLGARGARGPSIPLFTSIGFDLTVTSLFLPLISGGTALIYEESESGPDLALLDVIKDNQADFIKLTPSHLALLKGKNYPESRLKTMIVGGEDFKTDLAKAIQNAFPAELKIYNEYGPTEATVGCIVHQFDAKNTPQTSVPIGLPIANTEIFILDKYGNTVPNGVVGELYISGAGLAENYWNRADLTAERFVTQYTDLSPRMYRTGDLARVNEDGIIEYLGRIDYQVKISGRRIELGEIEAVLNTHPDIENCVVVLQQHKKDADNPEHNCIKCGLPSNYPTAEFDEQGVCNLCTSFETYQERARRYFKTPDDLKALFATKQNHGGDYDCLSLLSGGKDSSYALGKLVEMGLKVLAFTLDNGYISEQAKDNVRRVVKELGVDHVFGSTPAMNEIFVDSLQRHCNVCNGCFKTIYTLSTQIALEKNIPFVVTGLSRGQFFETRLTEELFWKEDVDIEAIDQTVLTARKAYHKVNDAVNQLMDVSMFEDDSVFEKVQFVDYYRYTDVSLDEMLEYLDKRLPWERPTDTGRSTNCLINQVGIFVHKKEQGYSNYAFPYSWDVRIGHKTRDASLDEINEEIDVPEVQRIMAEIGYEDRDTDQAPRLVAYYTGKAISAAELRQYLAQKLPEYMIPNQFGHLDVLPLSANGKIDRTALPSLHAQPETATEYTAPTNELEEILTEIWTEVLNINQIGIHDNFLELGGTSLAAIRLTARIDEAFELEIPVNRIFEFPTIAGLAGHLEVVMTELMEE